MPVAPKQTAYAFLCYLYALSVQAINGGVCV